MSPEGQSSVGATHQGKGSSVESAGSGNFGADFLTPHFRAREFECRHCGAAGIKIELVQALEKLRALANKPILVNSGYRCPKHPVEARKKAPGKHSEGIAADIQVNGMTARELYRLAGYVPAFKGFGVDDKAGYVHVDIRETPAKWCYEGNQVVPWHEENA